MENKQNQQINLKTQFIEFKVNDVKIILELDISNVNQYIPFKISCQSDLPFSTVIIPPSPSEESISPSDPQLHSPE